MSLSFHVHCSCLFFTTLHPKVILVCRATRPYCPSARSGNIAQMSIFGIAASPLESSGKTSNSKLFCLFNKGQRRKICKRNGLGDNCQILAVRSDICKIGQLSDRTTVSADNCQIRQLSDRTTVRSDNCQIGQLSVGQLSVGHGQLSEKTVSALKKL